ncbi:beta-lactamase-like protein [Aspergillus bertholletiae]|uniref:Beta-lactamase-like protein n=1 Tax=Aspergillus bertholletiae TaxID=1226010 RepID=A0A5N7B597_9EURO|nr:beta-lactamase-like protein [Aspergillus bertholletiae]
MALPSPKVAGGFDKPVILRRLEAGYLYLPMHLFVQGAPKDQIRRVPSMSWLISHKPSNTNLVFDLGIRQDTHNYPPTLYERMQRLVRAEVPQDVFGSLQALNINPHSDIDTIIFSHLHYDHTGDPSRFGPATKFIIGPGAKRFVCGAETYPENAHSHYDSRGFPSLDRVIELPNDKDRNYWAELGPISAAHDWFGDGSVYVVNAPGHLSGHLNLLVSVGRDEWVYLAGDTTHDCAILTGTAQTAVYEDEQTGLAKCAHENKPVAEEHISLVRMLKEKCQVEVVLAHDSEWLAKNESRFR